MSDCIWNVHTAYLSKTNVVKCLVFYRSFCQPWKDLSSKSTDSETMDELHACQSLLVIISDVIGKKSLHSQFLSHQDLENCGVFNWERSILESQWCFWWFGSMIFAISGRIVCIIPPTFCVRTRVDCSLLESEICCTEGNEYQAI